MFFGSDENKEHFKSTIKIKKSKTSVYSPILLLLVAIAVGLFIYVGSTLDKPAAPALAGPSAVGGAACKASFRGMRGRA